MIIDTAQKGIMPEESEEWWKTENSQSKKSEDDTSEKIVKNIVINNIIKNEERYDGRSFQQEYERRFVGKENLSKALINLQDSDSTMIIWVLWAFLGYLGAHRFALGHYGIAILYLFTFGGLFVLWLGDAFILNTLIKNGRENQFINKIS